MDQHHSDLAHEVILLNFGGPTQSAEVEPFLRRLFDDPFIIRARIPASFRAMLARRIAKKRAPKAAAEYAEIGFSPINRLTEIQARLLESELRKRRPNTRVRVCNRYTAPFADDVVKELDPEKTRLFLLTLYPHFCHSTTVSSIRDFDQAFERHHGHRDVPSVRVFSWWHHARYLTHTFERLSSAMAKALQQDLKAPLSIVFSAHGIPTRYDQRGDPYVIEIKGHFTEMRRRGEAWLKTFDGGKHVGRVHWQLSFQSRVGPVEWVKPYTEVTLAELGKSRGGQALLVPVSFTSDHIETLYEMDHTYRNLALASGFISYSRAVPSNDDPELAACLAEILDGHGF